MNTLSPLIVSPNATGVASWQNAASSSKNFSALFISAAQTYGLWTIPLPAGLNVGDVVYVQCQVTFANIPSNIYGFMGLSLQYQDSVQTNIVGGWNYSPVRCGISTGNGWGSGILPMASYCSATLAFTIRSTSGQGLNLLFSQATDFNFAGQATTATVRAGDLQIVRLAQSATGAAMI